MSGLRAIALCAAAVLCAAPAAADVVIFSGSGFASRAEINEDLPGPGKYLFELTSESPAFLEITPWYILYYDVYRTPGPRQGRESLDGNETFIGSAAYAFGTSLSLTFEVRETTVTTFLSGGPVYQVPQGTLLYREIGAQDPAFTMIMQTEGDPEPAFNYSYRVTQLMPPPPPNQGETVELPTAVPEPSAWAVMILGFGLAGAGLRRRRSTPVAAPAR